MVCEMTGSRRMKERGTRRNAIGSVSRNDGKRAKCCCGQLAGFDVRATTNSTESDECVGPTGGEAIARKAHKRTVLN